jgi:hypothetical protein
LKLNDSALSPLNLSIRWWRFFTPLSVIRIWGEFGRSTHEARSFAELKSAVEKGLSTVGLMLFMQLDHGAILRKETGRETPKMIRFVIGNPLIMKEMVKHIPDNLY